VVQTVDFCGRREDLRRTIILVAADRQSVRTGRMNAASRSLSLRCFALCAASLAIATGCTGRQSPEQRLQKALRAAGQIKDTVFPLAGHVLVDGAPPAYDPQRPVVVALIVGGKSAEPAAGCRIAECDPDGHFSFSTYARDDGVKPGRYVVAIARLWRTAPRSYAGPDEFHNRYNDPDKNALEPTLQIEHKSPGKGDYEFHLQIAGADPVETPGPHGVTHFP
jgi:hypothetical protein